ncbi:anhydro-N-acetylmuramic acid kinase [Cloacibacterium rupense]|uniref:Anhydro-N-acetylmuramic acid kinase n=1 Tax=Cloacibacterium rupense TaxID=517423 RepID=A0ABQ2NMJ8_9FLAO|nr:anhydro-N-acetylmuramic acid kinase [Cloacibacterium rupense]GGP06066.1 anhydro-N-acetylmuramic acid kinase [Cloacibacterium rupense]
MTKNSYFAIGLMSGTSLDGLDICYAKFEKNNHWSFEILHAETIPYPKTWEEELKNAIHISAEEITELHSNYGFYLGEKVNEFITKYQIKNLDLIASHGHTVFHQPKKKFTLQIGDGRAIKWLTKAPVIYDFRVQDVLMGGNGAPLVPIGDELLFHQFDACLNLGGFSNISLKINNQRIAFDICPVNIVLNSLAQKIGMNYDEDGKIARLGKIDSELLNQLNNLSFYQQSFPKSLGIEWVLENVTSKLTKQSTEDLLATFTEHSAIQIANTLNQFQLKNVLITGGGAYHTYLIEKIKSKTSTEIIIPEKSIIDYKEALIFALMGVLRLNNEINVLASATGSSENHSSGIIA